MNETCRISNEETKVNLEAMMGELAEQAGFSEAEWSCIADITCGSMLFDPLTLRHIHMDIQDAEAPYFVKWEVRREDILAKFAKLDSLSRLAVALRSRSLFED